MMPTTMFWFFVGACLVSCIVEYLTFSTSVVAVIGPSSVILSGLDCTESPSGQRAQRAKSEGPVSRRGFLVEAKRSRRAQEAQE